MIPLRIHDKRWSSVALIWLIVQVGNAFGGSLHFDQPLYQVAVGEAFQVQLLLDMDDEAVGDQIPASGLFSLGVQVSLEAQLLVSNGVAGIQLPVQLNGDGANGPPLKRVLENRVEAAGAVDFNATTGYPDARLLTVTISGLSTGIYTITPALLWPDPQVNFLDFNGVELDGQITTFQPATVQVSEPEFVQVIDFSNSGTTWQMDFTGTDYAPARYGVESASALLPFEWNEEPGAVVQRLSAGRFRATFSSSLAIPTLFRIVVAGSP